MASKNIILLLLLVLYQKLSLYFCAENSYFRFCVYFGDGKGVGISIGCIILFYDIQMNVRHCNQQQQLHR